MSELLAIGLLLTNENSHEGTLLWGKKYICAFIVSHEQILSKIKFKITFEKRL